MPIIFLQFISRIPLHF